MAVFILHNFLIECRTEAENDDGDFLDQYEREMRTQLPADANIEVDDDEEVDEEAYVSKRRLEKQINDFERINNLKV